MTKSKVLHLKTWSDMIPALTQIRWSNANALVPKSTTKTC